MACVSCWLGCCLILFFVTSGWSYRRSGASSGLRSKAVQQFPLRNVASNLVDVILNSPFRGPIVQAARNTMVKSVAEVGLDWDGLYESVYRTKDWDREVSTIIAENPTLITPSYYKSRFHAYDAGNLCIQAALEQELAGKAMGVRNFPSYKAQAEAHLRSLYDQQICQLGGHLLPFTPSSSITRQIVDFGCGTGTSTRRLARLFSSASTATSSGTSSIRITGIDLSPHMIAVGRTLQDLVPQEKLAWVEDIAADNRISLLYGDCAQTSFPSQSVDFVNMCFLLHELPYAAARDIIQEAGRILKPGGVLSILEMDPTSPGYRKSRQNAALFAIFKSTEPFLDSYFDETVPRLPQLLSEAGFASSTTVAATGRHFCCVARKEGHINARVDDQARLYMDEHLASPLLQPSKLK